MKIEFVKVWILNFFGNVKFTKGIIIQKGNRMFEVFTF